MVGGVLTQLQVIHALLLRETKTRFGEHRLGYLWALIQPMLWIGTFVLLYSLLGRLAPPGTAVVPFLVTGVVTFSLFRDTVSQTVSAISGNRGLLFYPQVRPLDLVISRAVLEWATQLTVFGLLMGASALYEGKLRVDSILQTLAGLALAAALGGAMGLLLCGLTTLSPTVERLHGPLFRPLFWLSAMFYPADSVPMAMREIILYNPLVHAIELVRDGWFPGYQSRHIDPWYAVAWVLVLLFFGLSLERVARRRLELT